MKVTESYRPDAGCWTGPKARMEAQTTKLWLISEYMFHDKAIKVERSGGGTLTEWRLYFPLLREYWHPESMEHTDWTKEAREKARRYREAA